MTLLMMTGKSALKHVVPSAWKKPWVSLKLKSNCGQQGDYLQCLRFNTGSSSIQKETQFLSLLKSERCGTVELTTNEELGIANVVLSNPEKNNALSGKMILELKEIVDHLENWKTGRGLIISGTNSTFCSGLELDLVQNVCEQKLAGELCKFMQSLASRIWLMPLISLALIEGYAIGGGAELATATDFRVMSPNARLGFMHSKLNVTTGFGATYRLVNLLGRTKALDILTSGRILSAKEAMRIGLANAVLDNEEDVLDWLMLHTRGTANQFKDLMNSSSEVTMMGESLKREHHMFCKVFGSEEHIQAMNSKTKHR